jgi:hypothetical protein
MVKLVCKVSEFYSETAVRKRRDGELNEFAEWYRHVYRYTTPFPLPHATRRAKVVGISRQIEMSPIECAVFDTNAKTLELMQKASQYWRCLRYNLAYNQVAVPSFSMLASGIVNAAVNGGTKVFQDLFFESELKNEAIVEKFAPSLKIAFSDQLKAVNFALRVHEHVIAPDYIPLHANLLENFENMKQVMKPAIGEVDLTEPAGFGEIPATDFLLQC